MRIAFKVLLMAVALTLSAGAAPAAMVFPAAMHGRPLHGPPDAAQRYICKVLPRYGVGVCSAPPFAPLGKRCSCQGQHGPRFGVVSTR